MQLAIPILVILILVLLNGMFVAAEFSIIGVRPTRIGHLAQKGNRAARWVHEVIESTPKTDRFIAAAQLGITLASLGLGMYAEPAIARLIEGPLEAGLGFSQATIHTISFIFSLSLITYLHVVIGEMVPKSLALQDSERMVLILAAPMRLMGNLFSFPIRLLNQIGLLVLRILRVPPPSKESRKYTPDELELIVSESHEGGFLAEHEHELVENIFDFSERRVVEVMTPRTRIDAITVDISEEELVEKCIDGNHTRYPVYEGNLDNIIGILHLKDLVRQQVSDREFDLRSMIRQVPFVPEGMLVEVLLASFRRQHIHIAVVLDEHGGTSGLVTLEDLIEEVVGEVRDEFDLGERPPITLLEPGHILVEGNYLLDSLRDVVEVDDRGHNVHTIAGLVMAELGLPPQEGAEVNLGEVMLRVEEVDGLSIQRVSIFYPPEKT